MRDKLLLAFATGLFCGALLLSAKIQLQNNSSNNTVKFRRSSFVVIAGLNVFEDTTTPSPLSHQSPEPPTHDSTPPTTTTTVSTQITPTAIATPNTEAIPTPTETPTLTPTPTPTTTTAPPQETHSTPTTTTTTNTNNTPPHGGSSFDAKALFQLDIDLGISAQCSREFGADRIAFAQHSRIDVCSGFGSASHLRCHNLHNTQGQRMLCVAKNAHVRLQAPFYDGGNSDVSTQASVNIRDGLFEIDCASKMYEWVPASQWDGATGHFLKGMNVVSSPLDCQAGTVAHPVIFLERTTGNELVHVMEDLLAVYEALIMLDIDAHDAELVVYDGEVANDPSFAIWSAIFGKGVRVVRRDNFYPSNTCFAHAVAPIRASSPPRFSQADREATTCASPIAQALSGLLVSSLGFEANTSPPTHTIVLLQHPALSSFATFAKDKLPTGWALEMFDPSQLNSMKDRAAKLVEASIFVGVQQGDALGYLLLLYRRASVVEVFVGEHRPTKNECRNLCSWLGLHHNATPHFADAVDNQQLWETVQSVVDAQKK